MQYLESTNFHKGTGQRYRRSQWIVPWRSIEQILKVSSIECCDWLVGSGNRESWKWWHNTSTFVVLALLLPWYILLVQLNRIPRLWTIISGGLVSRHPMFGTQPSGWSWFRSNSHDCTWQSKKSRWFVLGINQDAQCHLTIFAHTSQILCWHSPYWKSLLLCRPRGGNWAALNELPC